jgi:hypothetical protein
MGAAQQGCSVCFVGLRKSHSHLLFLLLASSPLSIILVVLQLAFSFMFWGIAAAIRLFHKSVGCPVRPSALHSSESSSTGHATMPNIAVWDREDHV